MQLKKLCQLGLLFFLAAILASGCGTWKSVKHWAGYRSTDDEAETAPPEAQQQTVMIDGKPYVRSKNPYWLTYPDVPEYLYVPKGQEFHGLQYYLIQALAKAIGKEKAKTQGGTVPPEKLQQLVRAEVDRIMKEQGLAGFVSRTHGAEAMTVVGRSVAVIPDLETPSSYQGLNRTLAMALGDSLGHTKDLKVSTPDQVQEALHKAKVMGKLTLSDNIKALGDALGVQGIVLTGLVPPQRGGEGALVLQVFNTFTGLKEDAVVSPAGAGGIKPETVTKFAQNNYLRMAGDLLKITWFGRVDFVKNGKLYLNLGESAGLKVGDRLRVVQPGKEVINPQTHSILGYTADIPQGEVKVTELLGKSAAVATPVSGGPFKANDKVKTVK
jgi:hypothetical protein